MAHSINEFAAAYDAFIRADEAYWRVLVDELDEVTALLHRNKSSLHSQHASALRTAYRRAHFEMIEAYKKLKEHR